MQVPEGYLDRRRPFPITVLGYRLVVWWDAVEGAWRCFEDKCPHRLAPLSGKIINALFSVGGTQQ